MEIRHLVNPLPRSAIKPLGLSSEAGPEAVRALVNLGYLGPRDYIQALSLCRRTLWWKSWFKLFCLWSLVGSSLVAGIVALMTLTIGGGGIFLIAVMDLSVVACAAAAWFMGTDSAAGKFFLFLVVIQGGAVLGMVDRVYPVATETWRTVAILTLASACLLPAGRSAFLTTLCAGLVNLTVLLWGFTVVMPEGWVSWPFFAVGMAALNAGLLFGREKLTDMGIGKGWVDRPYLGFALMLASLVYVSIPALAFFSRINTFRTVVGVVMFAALAFVFASFYLWKRRNSAMLLPGVLWTALIVVLFLFRAVVVNAEGADLSVRIAAFASLVFLLHAGVLFLIARWDRD